MNEYVKENLNMEIITDNVTTVEQEIKAGYDSLNDMADECIESTKQSIKELEKYIGYYCAYAISLDGDFFGQGFVICDDKFNYIGFVRTI